MTVELSAIHLVNEGSYLVSNSHHNLEVDGIPVKERTFVVSDLSGIRLVKTNHPKIISYKKVETGEVKSLETHLLESRELLSKASDTEELLFKSLEDEFAYKLYVRTWQPVYSELTYEKLPVKVTVTEVRTESGDPEIKSLWNAPNVGSGCHLYDLDRNAYSVRIFQEACNASSLDFSNSNHSGVRFAKLQGKYVFDAGMDFGNRTFIGTLEQCKHEKERILKRINSVIALHLARRNGVKVSNIADVVDKLRAIMGHVSSVTPMKASNKKHQESMNLLSELLSDLQKQVLPTDG